MGNKETRHNAILQIISREVVETQEALMILLNEQGYNTTQATVSRDIKELMLTKVPLESGGSRYMLPSAPISILTSNEITERMRRIFATTVLSVTGAQNLAVVKTMPGAAQTASEAVDTLEMAEVVGTIAGDNTFIIIARQAEDVPGIIDRLRRMQSGVDVVSPQ